MQVQAGTSQVLDLRPRQHSRYLGVEIRLDNFDIHSLPLDM